MDNWLQITLRMPVFIAVVLVLVIIGGIGAGIIFLRKQRVRMKSLVVENEYLQKTSNIPLEPGSVSKDRQAYEYFLQNISHEVSNPLQIIQTNLDNMAHCSPDETDRWQQYYQNISKEIRRLATLTESLRQLSWLESSNRQIIREPVNLKAVIETVIMSQSDFAEQKGIRLRYHGLERPARVLGNRDNLEQVFQNLIGNSIKYAKEGGGEVIISVQDDDDDRLCVRVIDDGIGIPKEDLHHIFATIYRSPDTLRTGQTGTGLGLLIVKRIIDQHEGHIRIESESGRGTTVSFDLPKYKPSTETQPE